MLTDPAGAFFGLWQPIETAASRCVGEAGAPISIQLTTREYAKALDFYRPGVGWQIDPVLRHRRIPLQLKPISTAKPWWHAWMETTALRGRAIDWAFFRAADDVDKTVDAGQRQRRQRRSAPRGHPVRPVGRWSPTRPARGVQPVRRLDSVPHRAADVALTLAQGREQFAVGPTR